MVSLSLEGKGYVVRLSERAHKKLFYLMRNISSLVNGREVGAWLTGEIVSDDDNVIVTVVDVYVPFQETSASEVDITPKQTVQLLKDIPEGENIIGHWHIHPFSSGSTSWSGTDNEKIRQLMEANTRKFFVFLLSSTSQIHARIEEKLQGLHGEVLLSTDEIPVSFVEPEDSVTQEFMGLVRERVQTKTWTPANNSYSSLSADDVIIKRVGKEIVIDARFGSKSSQVIDLLAEILKLNLIGYEAIRLENEGATIVLKDKLSKSAAKALIKELRDELAELLGITKQQQMLDYEEYWDAYEDERYGSLNNNNYYGIHTRR